MPTHKKCILDNYNNLAFLFELEKFREAQQMSKEKKILVYIYSITQSINWGSLLSGMPFYCRSINPTRVARAAIIKLQIGSPSPLRIKNIVQRPAGPSSKRYWGEQHNKPTKIFSRVSTENMVIVYYSPRFSSLTSSEQQQTDRQAGAQIETTARTQRDRIMDSYQIGPL